MSAISAVPADSLTTAPKLPRRRVLAVLLVAFVVYLPAVFNGFAMDDEPIASSVCVARPGEPDPVITADYDEDAFGYLGKFFVRPYWYPESHNDGLYRPISSLSYGLVYQLIARPFLAVRLEPAPQHALNVLLHVWAVWLVMALLARVGASGSVSLLTGLLFGVHAIHSEVVAGIVGRAEILAFCFGAQAMLLLNRGRWWGYPLGGLMMFLAYGAKESAFAWIPFYACFQLTWSWNRCPAARRPVVGRPETAWYQPLLDRRLLYAGLAMLLPILLWAGLRAEAMAFEPPIASPADWSSNPLGHLSATARMLTGVKVWGYASWLCLVPLPLSCLYSPDVFSIVETPFDLGFLASLLWLVGLLSAGLWFGRRLPLLFFAVTCFLGFSFLTSNVPLAIGTILGERLYYTPSLGICLLPGVLLPFLRRRGRIAFAVAIAIWCTGNTIMVVYRTLAWRDAAVLFLTDVQTYPMSIDLHRKCATVYATPGPRQDFDRAIEHLRIAKRILPTYVHAFREMGKIYFRTKAFAQAIREYEGALAVGRDYGDPVGAESIAYRAIGDCKLELSRAATELADKFQLIRAAETWYRKPLAVPLWGDAYGEAHNRLADCALARRELAATPAEQHRWLVEALRHYQATIALDQPRQQSRRVAFRRIFQHAVESSPPALPKPELQRLFDLAKGCAGGDHRLLLLMGAMAYKAGLPMQDVYESLHFAFADYPRQQQNLDYLKAHLFYADALLHLGRTREAMGIWQMLLGKPEFPAELKQQIRAKIGPPK